MSEQVLHLDFISLSPNTGPNDRQQLFDAAAALSALPQVASLGVIEADAASYSDFDLVFYFLLSGFSALEPFGTDSRYAGFLQGAVAPRLRAFAGADVRLEADFSADGPRSACLAIMAPEETYDWEVREALQAWRDASGSAAGALGLAVGEKQMYRGAALAFGRSLTTPEPPDVAKFRTTLVAGEARSLA